MNKDYCVWDVMPCGLVVINPVNGSSNNLTNYGTRILNDVTCNRNICIHSCLTSKQEMGLV